MSLYHAIGEPLIKQVITEFYLRAFDDPIIGHIFFKHDRQHITAQQIDFAINMLGGPKRYQGKPLREAHKHLPLKVSHFKRRQVLMREVLADLQVEDDSAKAWLALEEQLRPLIVGDMTACNK